MWEGGRRCSSLARQVSRTIIIQCTHMSKEQSNIFFTAILLLQFHRISREYIFSPPPAFAEKVFCLRGRTY